MAVAFLSSCPPYAAREEWVVRFKLAPRSGGPMDKKLEDSVKKINTAEEKGDISSLQEVLAPDFIGIGPKGFILGKDDWISRHKRGDPKYFKYDSIRFSELQIRNYGEAAIANCVQDSKAMFHGKDVGGRFRITIVLIKRGAEWLVANYQFSSMPDAEKSTG